MNNENENVLSGLNYAFDYAQFSNIGTYTIIPMDAKAENYKITYENGVLNVQPKPVEIKMERRVFSIMMAHRSWSRQKRLAR